VISANQLVLFVDTAERKGHPTMWASIVKRRDLAFVRPKQYQRFTNDRSGERPAWSDVLGKCRDVPTIANEHIQCAFSSR
jgi:hypothetical protein